jgi:hypothetical protein
MVISALLGGPNELTSWLRNIYGKNAGHFFLLSPELKAVL